MDKLKVTGWTHWDDERHIRRETYSDQDFEEATQAVTEAIKAHGLSFSGSYHQNGEYGVPVLSDGTLYQVSMRTWGRVMAQAHGTDGDMDYVEWYMDAGDGEVLPSGETHD